MRTIDKVKKALKDPLYICNGLLKKMSPYIKDDEMYVKLRFFCCIHKRLNLKNPKTFNEKLQWLKLYGYKPEYALMADKYRVKEIVANKIGEQYVVPCYGTWKNVDEIDFSSLPEQFVMKCNHDSGGNFGICKDRSTFDFEKVKQRLKGSLLHGYYWPGRDKQYRDIDRLVLAEKYLDDGRDCGLQDYKFWCFNGEPKVMYITNKPVGGGIIYENFYDMNFTPMFIVHGYKRYTPEYDKPDGFDEMKRLASVLSVGVPFVRVDFYNVNGRVYFGEYTFFDWGGFQPFAGKWDEKLGEWLTLPANG